MGIFSKQQFTWGFAILAVLLIIQGAVWGQGSRGAITGVVRDTSGAIIPGVVITVTNEQTGSKITVQSMPDGVYHAPQLLPGDYTISAEQPGFKRVTISGLKLDVAGTRTQDLALEVGAVSDTVTVRGQSNLVETASPEVSTTVPLDHVLEMPLVDRNVFNLINLTPGGMFSNQSANFFTSSQPRAYINGSRGWETASTLDGVSNMRGALGTQNMEVLPPVDAMQEFKVLTSNFSAEYGRTGGATVTSVTKSGTNAFHGAFYEFLRNDKLDAKGWGNDSKPPLRRNNFGGNIGGPIRKNKAFFFFNFDGLRAGQGSSLTLNMGLPEWRQGNFSNATRQAGTTAALVPIYDPDTGTGTFAAPLGTLQFPGNIIPANRLDPVSVKAVAFLVAPNRAPDNPFTQAGNWQTNRVDRNTRDFYIGRVDYELSSSTKLFFRAVITKPEVLARPAVWGPGDSALLEQRFGHQNHTINMTHLFSPTFFVNLAVGYNRAMYANNGGSCCESDFASQLGLANPYLTGLPSFGYGGGLIPVNGVGGNSYREEAHNTFDFISNFTKSKNNHTLKFGIQYTAFGGNAAVRNGLGYSSDGRFTTGYTSTGTVVANSGISMADFLLGRIVSVSALRQPMVGKRVKYVGAYIQDDWRVTPNLTLNLGVRYDMETPVYEVANRLANFDPTVPNPLAGTGDIPAGAMGVMLFQNKNGQGEYLYRWDKNNFAPRFGFAYRLFGSSNTSLRGGYGLFYGSSLADAPVFMGRDPWLQNISLAHPVPFRIRDGFPLSAYLVASDAELTPTWGNRGTKFEKSAIGFIDKNRVFPYSQDINLTLQHQWKGILFETGYRGNLARHVQINALNLNRIPPSLLTQTNIPPRLRRPFTIFGSDQPAVNLSQGNFGLSNYHAFVVKVERRFSNGFAWIASYTHAKQIDNATYVDGSQLGGNDNYQNFYDMKNERALSTGNVAHRLVISPIVDLPFGKGRKWMNRGGVSNAVLGGWQVSAIGTMQSGFPFGAVVLNGGRDLLGDAGGGVVLRPNLVATNLNSSNQGQPATGLRGLQWLDAAAFANPARFAYGNAARTLPGVTGPGLVSFDSMLAKNFAFADRWRAQFRWEMFDTFNSPQFGQPGNSFGSANFGQVTSAAAWGRRIMQLGLKLYW